MSVAEPLRVLIVDDHAIVRAGLRALLETEGDITVVAETSTGGGAVRLTKQFRPDVVLMDIRLGSPSHEHSTAMDDAERHVETDGIAATRAIIAAAPETNIVMLTSHRSTDDLVRALAAGARGYILKAGDPDELIRAIRSGAAGGAGLGREALELLVEQATRPSALFSEREIQVLRLLSTGMRNREIAAHLHLSEATVKTHLARIYPKLGVDTRVAAISQALRRGILSVD